MYAVLSSVPCLPSATHPRQTVWARDKLRASGLVKPRSGRSALPDTGEAFWYSALADDPAPWGLRRRGIGVAGRSVVTITGTGPAPSPLPRSAVPVLAVVVASAVGLVRSRAGGQREGTAGLRRTALRA
jgi:hypothetical protein